MVRDRVSANTINSAPRTAETGNTLRCEGPQSSLDKCGTTRPMNPIVPVNATLVPVSKAAIAMTILRVLATSSPRWRACRSPKDNRSRCLANSVRTMQQPMMTGAATASLVSQ